MPEERPICEGCKCEIDPETCECGESKDGACDNHYFSPMGCRCWERVEEALLAPGKQKKEQER